MSGFKPVFITSEMPKLPASDPEPATRAAIANIKVEKRPRVLSAVIVHRFCDEKGLAETPGENVHDPFTCFQRSIVRNGAARLLPRVMCFDKLGLAVQRQLHCVPDIPTATLVTCDGALDGDVEQIGYVALRKGATYFRCRWKGKWLD